MRKALTGIVLLFMSAGLHAQWQFVSPNTYFTGGKVGIGTSVPQQNLHIKGTNATNSELMIENSDDWYASMFFKSNGKVWGLGKRPSFENDALQLWYADPAVAGGAWQGPFFTFTPNGSVGIGTTKTADAGYKLFVETGIRTRKIVVDQATWPDYVFHPYYSLPSLPSVAAYIKYNHHLPDMPSADSVAKNGIDLGGNQAQLLKKIEELTLYVIQLQQQVDALKKDAKKHQKR